jgi:hypothetical protein
MPSTAAHLPHASLIPVVQPALGSALARQRALDAFNRRRLTPRVGGADWEKELEHEHAMRMLEGRFVQAERAEILRLAQDAPDQPEAFVHWFEQLKLWGPGQGDRLFPWLARHASLAQMKWFLTQEMAGEAGFEDLVALAQVKLPTRPKLEMARNYWDEMGRGHTSGMHGLLLRDLADALSIEVEDEAVWEALALGNLMIALACDRRYAYHAVGALGVIELTAPGRAEHVNAGLKRLGVSGAARRYFALHATLDVKHSLAWNREVIAPLVAEHPEAARALAEGALMRLNAGARCFERYRRALCVR